MKKFLSFALLLSSFMVLKAQTQISFVCNGQTYQNGESIVVTLENNYNSGTITMHNNTSSPLQGLVITATQIESHGIEVSAICTDQCVPGLVSTPFNIAPEADYPVIIDFDLDETIADPYCVYNFEVSNGTITSSVVVRFQISSLGISDVVANRLSAYPNPAEGQVNISYEVAQPSTLAVYDMQGRVVRQLAVTGSGNAVIDNLPAGIYAYGFLGSNTMRKLIVK